MSDFLKKIDPFFNVVFMNNKLSDYIITIIIFVVSILLLLMVDKIIIVRLKKFAEKTETSIDDFVIHIFEKNIIPLVYFGSFFLATRNLILDKNVERVISVFGMVFASFFILNTISKSVKLILENKSLNSSNKTENISKIIPVINFIIWSIGAVFLLDNLGFNISAVITGLGIGGVAIAMASQTILGDLFSYFSILFDKPFECGDFIVVDNYMGSVEKIGVKTTRVKSLTGEMLIFSNTDLIKARVRNYKQMKERRVSFELSIAYETPVDKLLFLNLEIEKIVKNIPGVRFDRTHFKSLGDYALIFEVVYFVLSQEYNIYMDIQQEINLNIFKLAKENEIGFAYPTQTLFINK